MQILTQNIWVGAHECISNKIAGDAQAAGLQKALEPVLEEEEVFTHYFSSTCHREGTLQPAGMKVVSA